MKTFAEIFRPAVSSGEMARLDELTIQAGTPATVLMERAGKAVYRLMLDKLSGRLGAPARVVVLCGPGNNGGDGLVVARNLKERGFRVQPVLLCAQRYSAGFLEQVNNFCNSRGRGLKIDICLFGGQSEALEGYRPQLVSAEQLCQMLMVSDCVVDALLGTGSKKSPEGNLRDVIALLAEVQKSDKAPFVVAIDIPTGINPDTGTVSGLAVKADLTVCIELLKRGLVQWPARDFCGEIAYAPIGIQLVGNAEFGVLEPERLPVIPARPVAAHKGNFGRLLVVGGSRNMPGAAVLAANAGMRAGAGTVVLASMASWSNAALRPEVMRCEIDGGAASFNSGSLETLCQAAENADALVLGPGLGAGQDSLAFFGPFLQHVLHLRLPTVLDADGLNLLGQILMAADSPLDLSSFILTPHPGEMGRLLGISSEAVQADRFSAVKSLFEQTQAQIVLKGAGAIVYANGHGIISPVANPFLATAGSGDVLAGIMGALLSQRLSLAGAALYALHIHSLCAVEAEKRVGLPFVASDLIDCIPRVFPWK